MSSRQLKAIVRVCASCEWVFREGLHGPIWKSTKYPSCPKCGSVSYGARSVYGPVAYRYEISQTPWKKRKLEEYERKLLNEIRSEQDTLFKQ